MEGNPPLFWLHFPRALISSNSGNSSSSPLQAVSVPSAGSPWTHLPQAPGTAPGSCIGSLSLMPPLLLMICVAFFLNYAFYLCVPHSSYSASPSLPLQATVLLPSPTVPLVGPDTTQ